ncbi:hypothetical protein LSH36_732g00016 [Paralvinella palmiformis]|uniref:Uncharacterized protein n=1 Tax=Paralvinella palmiformis TaxID=53620 RepID=A0AAD9J1S7_9ANNE|nr:hypothetical protein LSH36_732g00016 [Paralvinella palmiformis]
MWAEWDFISQRLYILYPTKPTRLNGYTRKNLLSCYQFTENLIAQNTFELCLDIPIPFCDDQSEFGSLYYEANGSRVIPDVCLKMRVLSKENGTLCICYQHNGHLSSPTTCNTFSPQTGINKSNGESNSDRCKGLEHCGETVSEYTVILVHKKKTLCCERLSLMPSLLYEMIFFWYGSYLVVHVPGCWTHLINTESDEPSLHNIMWTDPEWHPDQSQSHGIKLDTVLVPVNWKARKSLGSYIYQNQSLHLIQLNPSTLCKMFITQPTKRVALLHLAVVHVEDLSFIKELLSIICEDVIPSTVELFQEFLIGSTYTQFCHIAPKWACQLVPCTVDGENHTMTAAEIPANSSSLHRLTYKYGLRLEKQLIVVRNLGAHHKYWIQMSMNLKMASASKSVRFSHRSLSTAVTRHQSVMINSHGDSSHAERSSPGFINKLKRLFRVVSVPETSCLGNPQYAHQMAAQEASIKIDKEVMKWKAEAVFGRLPKFLDPDQKGSSCSELVVKYIENGVLMLSMDFVLLIIRTLRDDHQGLEVKSQLISRLPKLDSLKCLRVWGHPSALEHYSYHYTASALAGSPSDVQRHLNVPANDDPVLCPLNLFLDLIDRQKGKGDKESLDADRQLLTSSILSTFR